MGNKGKKIIYYVSVLLFNIIIALIVVFNIGNISFITIDNINSLFVFSRKNACEREEV